MLKVFLKLFLVILLFQVAEKYGLSQKHPQLQTLGVMAGSGLYGIRSGEFYDEFDKNLSIHFAPVINYSLSDNLLICSGVGYELKGAPDSRFNYNTRLSYLIIPVYGKFLFNKTPRFYGLAGIYGGYLLNATKKGEMKIGPDVFPVNENVLSEFKKMDYGLIAGAGYMIRLNIDIDFFVELKANIGLANIEKSPSFRPKNYGYSLSLGYLYYIGFR